MSARRAVFVAAAAAVAGALLLGGNVTYAAWSDSANSEPTRITAGSLTAKITQSGPASVPNGTSKGVYPAAGSKGIIPGVQAQQWKYIVENLSDSAVAADGTLEINGSVANAEDYAALRPYLSASASVNGVKTTIPGSAFTSNGFRYTVNLGQTLKPGDKRTVELTFQIPAVVKDSSGKTIADVAVEQRGRRSANTDMQQVFTMTNSAHLTQAPRQ